SKAFLCPSASSPRELLQQTRQRRVDEEKILQLLHQCRDPVKSNLSLI
ncbi:uncharacterized, partial [Tachysurus ichikawai]